MGVGRFACLCSLVFVVTVDAAAFALTALSDLRTDRVIAWETFSDTDGTAVPRSTAFQDGLGATALRTASDGGLLQIADSPDYAMDGALLESPGGAAIVLDLVEPVQAAGLFAEPRSADSTTFILTLFDTEDVSIGRSEVRASGAAPVFLGFNDRDGRTASLRIDASPPASFAVADLHLQDAMVPESDPLVLPVTATHQITVNPATTYLHEGLKVQGVSSATGIASTDYANSLALRTVFPSLRAGDLIRFERQGFAGFGDAFNPLLGVFTADETLLAGREFRRVPGALRAGTSFYTAKVRGNASFDTPTNIPEDFIIGASTFVAVPPEAEFLFLSLERTGAGIAPTPVKLSHVPRDVFQDWKTANGLHGSRATLDDDFDGDGLTLIEEFAFQKDPIVADAHITEGFAFRPYVNFEADSAAFTVFFGARSDAPIRYRAEVSENLSRWDPVPSEDIFTFLADSGRARSVFGVLLSSETTENYFLRLIVEPVP